MKQVVLWDGKSWETFPISPKLVSPQEAGRKMIAARPDASTYFESDQK